MRRITTIIDDDMAERLGTFGTGIDAGNRSKVIRKLIRRGLGGRVDAPAVTSSLGV